MVLVSFVVHWGFFSNSELDLNVLTFSKKYALESFKTVSTSGSVTKRCLLARLRLNDAPAFMKSIKREWSDGRYGARFYYRSVGDFMLQLSTEKLFYRGFLSFIRNVVIRWRGKAGAPKLRRKYRSLYDPLSHLTIINKLIIIVL